MQLARANSNDASDFCDKSKTITIDHFNDCDSSDLRFWD
jgi:hypothetical protein